jgi:hypothetical protein
MNKVILYHPEYYTAEASLDRCPMRRYRICPGCVDVGCLMMAAHDDGCKQWPGGGARHQHVFCFHCTRFINVDVSTLCRIYMCICLYMPRPPSPHTLVFHDYLNIIYVFTPNIELGVYAATVHLVVTTLAFNK